MDSVACPITLIPSRPRHRSSLRSGSSTQLMKQVDETGGTWQDAREDHLHATGDSRLIRGVPRSVCGLARVFGVTPIRSKNDPGGWRDFQVSGLRGAGSGARRPCSCLAGDRGLKSGDHASLLGSAASAGCQGGAPLTAGTGFARCLSWLLEARPGCSASWEVREKAEVIVCPIRRSARSSGSRDGRSERRGASGTAQGGEGEPRGTRFGLGQSGEPGGSSP